MWSSHPASLQQEGATGAPTQEGQLCCSRKEQLVLQLKKALYGLKQVPRAGNIKLDACLAKLDAYLVKLGFAQCESEHDMYA
jgi:hypothetical protein